MFRTLIYPSSGACDYSVELPHWSYISWFDVSWSFGVVELEWYPCCRLKHNCNTDTTPAQKHRNSNTHRTKNNTTNVVIQQNSRKLVVMDKLMSETRWAHKKWNKIGEMLMLEHMLSLGRCRLTYCQKACDEFRVRFLQKVILHHDSGFTGSSGGNWKLVNSRLSVSRNVTEQQS